MVDWRLLLTIGGFLLAIGRDFWLQVEIADYWRWWLIVGVYCWLLVAIADQWWLLIIRDHWLLMAIAECCWLLWTIDGCCWKWVVLVSYWWFSLTIGGYCWYDMGWSQIIKHQGLLITNIWRVRIVLLPFFQPRPYKFILEKHPSLVSYISTGPMDLAYHGLSTLSRLAATVDAHVYQPSPTSVPGGQWIVTL